MRLKDVQRDSRLLIQPGRFTAVTKRVLHEFVRGTLQISPLVARRVNMPSALEMEPRTHANSSTWVERHG